MKNLSYCDTIEKILISESLNCDALIVSNTTLQYSIMYRSEILRTFTDNILAIGVQYVEREAVIRSLPRFIKENVWDISKVSKMLSKVNTSYSVYKVLVSIKDYLKEREKLKQLDNQKYIRLYSSKSDAFIWLNRRLLNTNFNDTFQSKLNAEDIAGMYLDEYGKYKIAIYLDPFTNLWMIENRVDSSQNYILIST